MALITMPAKFGFRSIAKWGLVRANNTMRSKFTGQRQVIVYPFAVWVLQGKLIEYPEGTEARDIRAFLALLDGQANTFQFPVPGYLAPSGGYAGNAQINAIAASNSLTVSLKGLPINSTPLKKGEYFTVNGELKLLTTDVNTDGAGIGNATFKPGLRAAVAVNDIVTLQNPYCIMASIDEDAATWGLGPPVKHDFDFNAMEAF